MSLTWDGRVAASIDVDQVVQLWDIPTGASSPRSRARRSEIPRRAIRKRSRSSAKLPAATCTIKIGERMIAIPHIRPAVAITPDARAVFAAGIDGKLHVWRPSAGVKREMESPFRHPRSVAPTVDGRLVVVGGKGPHIAVHDVAADQIRWLPPLREKDDRDYAIMWNEVAVTPDGRVAVAGRERCTASMGCRDGDDAPVDGGAHGPPDERGADARR